jgi:hypothetical protein
MDKKEQILSKIEETLKSKEKSIRNKNAVEQLISKIGLSELYNIFFGIKDKIDFERQKLTLDEVLELLIAVDERLSGLEQDHSNKITILLEEIIAKGDVTGFEANTSNGQVKEIFKNNPMDITVRKVASEGNVTGMKLNVDNRAELKQPLNVQGDFGSVQLNPGDGRKIIFGGNAEDSQ